MPIKLFLHGISIIPKHWHTSLELLFILEGTIEVLTNTNKYTLDEGDLILFNNNEVHSIQSKQSNVILALQISKDFLIDECGLNHEIVFKCISTNECDSNKKTFDDIRILLAKMMWFYSKDEKINKLKIKSLLFDLVHIFCIKFSVTKMLSEKGKLKNLDRLYRITQYMGKNYTKDITLSEVAEMEGLSPQYLSSFFKRYMGISFLKYLNSIRLKNAVNDLIFTDLTIIDIAFKNGFFNIKSFNNTFKSMYGDSPSKYRKIIRQDYTLLEITNNINYLKDEKHNALGKLYYYLNRDVDNKSNERIVTSTIEVNLHDQTKKIKHTWKNLITFGRAKEGLFKEVQEHLIDIQKSIGFKYVRFHGILDDDMMVYGEDKEGNTILNFVYIDKLIDFLYTIGLKPFIELSFMPRQMARENNRIFYYESIISMPKDLKKWDHLIRGLVNHCVNRYGMDEVETWYFEVWNEPEIKGAYWYDEYEDYYKLFQSSYNTIKSISKRIKVGGPSITSSNYSIDKYLVDFLEYTNSKGCTPDFISYHMYPREDLQLDWENINSEKIIKSNSKLNRVSNLSSNPDMLIEKIYQVKQKSTQVNPKIKEYHITEWNSTSFHRELINDTTFKGAYIVKNVLDTLDQVDSLGYWVASDLLEESRLSVNFFHGGLGLITNNGIKKPAFYGYSLLSKLGNELIVKKKCYAVTKSNKGYQVIIYNYSHYDKVYCLDETCSISLTDRYKVFLNNTVQKVSIKLNGIEQDKYRMKKYSLNRHCGSAFDEWVKMGYPSYLDKEEVEYLKCKSSLGIEVNNIDIKDEIIIKTELEPNEVQLYTIEKEYENDQSF